MSAVLGMAIAAAVLAAASAFAKLPPLGAEQKAQAEEAKGKAAYAARRDAYDLCRTMDRVALAYASRARAAGKPVTPTSTPACQDPDAGGGAVK